jgi:hypothetical protein
MSEQTRSVIAYEHAREASQRFEYFILGVSIGLCAYIGQTLSPQKLGLNPYTLEVCSLVMLIASIVVGFKLIESVIMCHRYNQAILHLAEERGQLVSNFTGSPLLNTESGILRSPEQVQERIAMLGKKIPGAKRKFKQKSAVVLRYYRIRNWLLGIGFIGLFVSKIIVPYFS